MFNSLSNIMFFNHFDENLSDLGGFFNVFKSIFSQDPGPSLWTWATVINHKRMQCFCFLPWARDVNSNYCCQYSGLRYCPAWLQYAVFVDSQAKRKLLRVRERRDESRVMKSAGTYKKTSILVSLSCTYYVTLNKSLVTSASASWSVD